MVGTAPLPRVTYSNVGTDFSGVHDLLDRLLPEVMAAVLGRERANFIGGRTDSDGKPYRALSPIDRDIHLGTFIAASAPAIDRAIAAAREAQRAWSRLPWRERVTLMRRAAELLEERKYELAIACLIEVGKSRLEALGEAEEAVDLVRYYCDEMERHEGFSRPLSRAFPEEETRDVLRPVGVFAVIAPFNFPLALSTNMMSAALLAGNAVVYKPSPMAGLTGALLIETLHRAGLPDGVVNLVCGGDETGRLLVERPGIDGVAFTGSHAAGMAIFRALANGPYMRPVVVEMGGKNPAYVTPHADLDAATSGVMRSAFGLQGQKCSACAKVYVHETVHDAFVTALIDKTSQIKVGNPEAREVFMGPVINEEAVERFTQASEHARQHGRVALGGTRLAGGLFDKGPYVPPTIVLDLPADHWLNRDELFLPFLSVQRFRSLPDAIVDGNSVDYGLTAGIYTQDEAELEAFLGSAEAGVLYANRPSGATTGAWPGIQSFCGWKGSGVTGKGGLGPWYLPQFMREQSHTVLRASP